MALFFAPAFFAHLFGKCLCSPHPLLAVTRLGTVVVLTCAVCWAPFLGSVTSASAVAGRLAPLHRGLFEDHVANLWCDAAQWLCIAGDYFHMLDWPLLVGRRCASSMLIKWKTLFTHAALARIAAGATIVAAAPSMLQQILHPSRRARQNSNDFRCWPQLVLCAASNLNTSPNSLQQWIHVLPVQQCHIVFFARYCTIINPQVTVFRVVHIRCIHADTL